MSLVYFESAWNLSDDLWEKSFDELLFNLISKVVFSDFLNFLQTFNWIRIKQEHVDSSLISMWHYHISFGLSFAEYKKHDFQQLIFRFSYQATLFC